MLCSWNTSLKVPRSNRIPIESLRIHNTYTLHLGKTFSPSLAQSLTENTMAKSIFV